MCCPQIPARQSRSVEDTSNNSCQLEESMMVAEATFTSRLVRGSGYQ